MIPDKWNSNNAVLEPSYPKLVLVFKFIRENVSLGVGIVHPCLYIQLGEGVAADLSKTLWENIVGNGNL